MHEMCYWPGIDVKRQDEGGYRKMLALEAGPQTRGGGAQAPEMSCGSCKCPGDVWHGYQS